jgi:hypothetical protein
VQYSRLQHGRYGIFAPLVVCARRLEGNQLGGSLILNYKQSGGGGFGRCLGNDTGLDLRHRVFLHSLRFPEGRSIALGMRR